MAHSFDAVVVEIDMRDLYRFRQALGFDSEAVIMRSDFDRSLLQILHGLIAAAMPELQFVGRAAERASQKLMPKADAERRHARLRDVSHLFDNLRHRSGIAWPVREIDAVRFQGQNFRSRSVGRHDRHTTTLAR